ncbi:MAG: hypothetical protein A3D31_14870 [Candidatus Fluviicola riflensis]|nr:MAG: hypothetical protein CHH17_19305 [Candidatus Fluviicola riflensis]OGS78246.1 MAG: hypothetical protein A3D31_14870 [Candidatus Fluviicola riflensis]OGS85312.1 MAG: hypothetical protein A2724_11805 [Fluviicola sp. RIFCSPHIGHO2_01_FULL_43_53]OGS87354.1 MAG: hypothetical protein A3E30_08225 [Fluviicola sp. RIFCSPHIGHO2_12_FULL_43_24]
MKCLILSMLVIEIVLAILFVFYVSKGFGKLVIGIFISYILVTSYKFFFRGAVAFEIQLMVRIVFYLSLVLYIIWQRFLKQMNTYECSILMTLLLIYGFGVYDQNSIILVLIPILMLTLLLSRKLFSLEHKEHVLILVLFTLDTARIGIDKVW